MSSGVPKEAERIIQLGPDTGFNTDELRRDVKGADYCNRLLENSRNEILVAEEFAKKIVRIRRGFPVSKAVL